MDGIHILEANYHQYLEKDIDRWIKENREQGTIITIKHSDLVISDKTQKLYTIAITYSTSKAPVQYPIKPGKDSDY